MKQNDFLQFTLYPEIQAKLAALNFVTPTEIQRRAIPILLGAHPVDFHGQAQTGTGKTLAFGIPLLHRIARDQKKTQALVLAPTRELAVQITESLKPLTETIGVSVEAVYGGVSMDTQVQRLRRGVHIVVGTPGRINDHMRRGSLSLDNVKTLVLDEADIMLDLGFKEDIDTILEELPQEREIWLFSATVKGGIDEILRTHMSQPQSVRVSREDVAAYTTKHYFCTVPMHARLAALCRFIDCNVDFYGFVFCQTKLLTAEIAEQLLVRGYRIGAIHGDMSQAQRNAIIKRFRAKEITILVATDVAARGIDVANLTHVINYSFPNDQESYIHRSGRTGRAGKEGIAITFINRHEMRDVKQMQSRYKVTMQPLDVPNREALIASRLRDLESYVASLKEKTCATVQQIEDVLAAQTEQDLRIMARVMLHEKFLTLHEEREQFGVTPALDDRSAAGSVGDAGSIAEFSLNVGSDDSVDRESVAQLFAERGIAAEAILKIRVLKRCTFVHCAPDAIESHMQALQGATLGGRSVRASRVSSEQTHNRRSHSSGGGRFSDGHRSGGRGGSGYHRKPRRDGENFSEYRSDRSSSDRGNRGERGGSERSSDRHFDRGSGDHKGGERRSRPSYQGSGRREGGRPSYRDRMPQ